MADSGPSIWRIPELWGAAGVAITQLAHWLRGRHQARRQAEAEARRQGHAEANSAFEHLMAVVRTLREEVDLVRRELAEERRRAEEAERQVRELREEVHALRTELVRHGLRVNWPPVAAAPTAAGHGGGGD